MTTYVTRQIQLTVTEQQNGEGQIIKRGDRSTKFNEDTTLEEGEFKKYVIAAPTTDKDLLEGTTIALGKILYIESDQEITVKLSSTGDTGIAVKPIDTTAPGILYYEGEFTHVYVTLGGTTNANVIMGVVGA